MDIKAQGFVYAAEHLLTTYGPERMSEILQRCDATVRERFVTATVIEWHPAEELEQLLQHASDVLQLPAASVAKAVGKAGAERNMGGFLRRVGFYMARREYALRRVSSTWLQFNAEGEMRIGELAQDRSHVEVVGHDPPGPLFCATLTGWCEVLALRVGAVRPFARHTRCVTRGDDRCRWDVDWAGIGVDDSSASQPPA